MTASQMTPAGFKALREICGITQQQAADALDVRVLTVKRWESGYTRIPADALEWIVAAAQDHDDAVAETVAKVREEIEPGGLVILPYYRTQEQLDAALDDAAPYQFANAVSRAAGEMLKGEYTVTFAYPEIETWKDA